MLNDEGLITTRWFLKGLPQTVAVDDYLVFSQDATTSKQSLAFAQATSENALWPAYAEKAWAKINGNFRHIANGDYGEALALLTGAPISQVETALVTVAEQDFLWAALQADLLLGNTIVAGAQTGTADGITNGILTNHGFTVLGAYDVTDKNGNALQLLNIRSPWKGVRYVGPYSKSSTQFTNDPALQTQLTTLGGQLSTSDEDGLSFIDFDSFLAYFDLFYVAHTNMDLQVNYIEFSPVSTVKKTFTISNPTDQTVFVTADILNERMTAPSCRNGSKSSVFFRLTDPSTGLV